MSSLGCWNVNFLNVGERKLYSVIMNGSFGAWTSEEPDENRHLFRSLKQLKHTDFLSVFLSFFLSFFFWPLLPTRIGVRVLLLYLITLKDTHTRKLTNTRTHTHAHAHTLGRTSLDEGSAPSQRPPPDNTQRSQQTHMHASGGNWTRNPSKRAATELRHRKCGDRRLLALRSH